MAANTTMNSDNDLTKLSAQLSAQTLERDLTLAQELQMHERDDLNRRLHDQKVANNILGIPDQEWKSTGGHCQMLYNKSVTGESSRVYIKGLVSEERVKECTVTVAGIGVAICDSNDHPIFELRKPLVDGEDKSLMSGVEVGIKALIEGLNAAIALDLKRVDCFCDDYLIHHYIMTTPSKTCNLGIEAVRLKLQFDKFSFSVVKQNDIKFAFKLARDALVSQITWPSESSSGKNLMETCNICFEDTDVGKMFSVDGCLHRFFFSCMKQHVKLRLLSGTMAKCPHQDCSSDVDIDKCGSFLDPKFIDIVKEREKEASIPVTEKVYCSYPKCSFLMSKLEVLEHTKKFYDDMREAGQVIRDGVSKCTKCDQFFCIDCKLPWHSDLTCSEYRSSNKYLSAEDAKLKSLASEKLWRQCAKCNNMIELAHGCFHIHCRCGYEFCYTCGAEWKNKAATCNCPLWTEANIVYNEVRR